MMIGITGTPGTGKSALSRELARRGYPVVSLVETLGPYILGKDPERDTMIVDECRWADEFPSVEGIVEGHLAHYLPCERIIILRCRPDRLASRLRSRGYSAEKVRENIEAEALDIILQETVDRFRMEQIYEIDATDCSIPALADYVERILKGTALPSCGSIDWSTFLQEPL